MAQFMGVVTGKAHTKASRLGSKSSGLIVTAASWQGCIKVELYHDDKEGVDKFHVYQDKWQNGAGIVETIAEGVVGQPVPKESDI